MKKIELTIPIEILIRDYLMLESSYKVAKKYNVSATAVKRVLKEQRVLRTQSEAAKKRNNSHLINSKMSEEGKSRLSKLAKSRTGERNPFYGKTHTLKVKAKLSDHAKSRTKKRNPNYRHGNNIRRPRDFKNFEMHKLRNDTFTRDDHTCKYCLIKGGHLHAHHTVPYWVNTSSYLDADNLITVCKVCHFKRAHLNNWQKFDVEIISDVIIKRYSLCRERLNELATFKIK